MNFDHVIPSGLKATQTIVRPDGSEVQLVATEVLNFAGPSSIDFYALGRQSSNQPWRVLSKLPHPGWRTMSVQEYCERGRSELLQAVTHGEIFKFTNAFRQAILQQQRSVASMA